MNENRCIVCGAIIPEGRQVCPNCEKKQKKREVKQHEQKESSENNFRIGELLDCTYENCKASYLKELR